MTISRRKVNNLARNGKIKLFDVVFDVAALLENGGSPIVTG